MEWGHGVLQWLRLCLSRRKTRYGVYWKECSSPTRQPFGGVDGGGYAASSAIPVHEWPSCAITIIESVNPKQSYQRR